MRSCPLSGTYLSANEELDDDVLFVTERAAKKSDMLRLKRDTSYSPRDADSSSRDVDSSSRDVDSSRCSSQEPDSPRDAFADLESRNTLLHSGKQTASCFCQKYCLWLLMLVV